MSESVGPFRQPMEMSRSLFRDLKLKRYKLAKSTATWFSDVSSVKSDSAVYMRGAEDRFQSDQDDVSSVASSQDFSSNTSWSEHDSSGINRPVSVSENDEVAQIRFDQFMRQLKQDAGGAVERQSAAGVSSFAAGQQMRQVVPMEQDTSESTTNDMIAQPMQYSQQGPTPQTVIPLPSVTVASSLLPQVVAFATMPATSMNGVPQVVAMATVPNGPTPGQVVALPLCNWPYDPMMLNRLLNPNGRGSGVSTASQERQSDTFTNQNTTAEASVDSVRGSIASMTPRQQNGSLEQSSMNRALFASVATSVVSGTFRPITMASSSAVTLSSHPYEADASRSVSSHGTPGSQFWAAGGAHVPDSSHGHTQQENNSRSERHSQHFPVSTHSVPGTVDNVHFNSRQGQQSLHFPQPYLPTTSSQTTWPSGPSASTSFGSQASAVGETSENEVTICEICEDKATGLHYGIITCEG